MGQIFVLFVSRFYSLLEARKQMASDLPISHKAENHVSVSSRSHKAHLIRDGGTSS